VGKSVLPHRWWFLPVCRLSPLPRYRATLARIWRFHGDKASPTLEWIRASIAPTRRGPGFSLVETRTGEHRLDRLLAPCQELPWITMRTDPPHFLLDALNDSITSGTFVDTKFYVFSRRQVSGRVGSPRALYCNSRVLDTVPYFSTCG